jgi:hypothetical protein
MCWIYEISNVYLKKVLGKTKIEVLDKEGVPKR